jgi:hypothetical protein
MTWGKVRATIAIRHRGVMAVEELYFRIVPVIALGVVLVPHVEFLIFVVGRASVCGAS